MPCLPMEKHPIVKQAYPLYDSAGAQNAIPANKNAPNRKVDTLFQKEKKNSFFLLKKRIDFTIGCVFDGRGSIFGTSGIVKWIRLLYDGAFFIGRLRIFTTD